MGLSGKSLVEPALADIFRTFLFVGIVTTRRSNKAFK